MDRRGSEELVDISVLASEIIKAIEREDAFENSKNNGGFIELIKAKNIKEVFL